MKYNNQMKMSEDTHKVTNKLKQKICSLHKLLGLRPQKLKTKIQELALDKLINRL